MKLQIMTEPNIVHDIDATEEEMTNFQTFMGTGKIANVDFEFVCFPGTETYISLGKIVAVHFIKEKPKANRRDIIHPSRN